MKKQATGTGAKPAFLNTPVTRVLLGLLASFVTLAETSAQTLFTYGKHAVSAKEYMRAFTKNNAQPSANKSKALRDYLGLFINSRLKIREAYDRGYDTLPSVVEEVKNLRAQIMENFMNDPAIMARLEKEAFTRSQKDIRVAHLFIAFQKNGERTDTSKAAEKLKTVLGRLQKGDDFLQVARDLSDEPGAKQTGGEIGYITVFTLPYEFENAVYNTPAGRYSPVVRSQAGYHIFKPLGERKAAGKIRARQILLAFPPDADEATKKRMQQLADSLYQRLRAGDNFNLLASSFSSDYVTAANGGLMPDISVGQYDPAFEKVLWGLSKDEELSRPFSTAHGWHILKRVSLVPVVTDAADKTNQLELQAKILADARSKSSRDFIYKLVKEKGRYKTYPYSEEGLRSVTDSILDLKPLNTAGRATRLDQPLFSLGDSVFTATTWLTYAVVHRHKRDGSNGIKPFEQVWDEFMKASLYNHYRDHLEDFNEEFRYQMAEFKDGNLFFEIMQQEVWNKSQSDSTALLALYDKNKQKYTWKKAADAVLFFCSDEATAGNAYAELKKDPAAWRQVVERYQDKTVADSSKYEWSQLPAPGAAAPRAGMVTAPVINPNDNTASFAWIVNVYDQPMQRSFSEAKGLVITDYQAVLEDQWVKALKKKYPVVVNQKVLGEISR